MIKIITIDHVQIAMPNGQEEQARNFYARAILLKFESKKVLTFEEYSDSI